MSEESYPKMEVEQGAPEERKAPTVSISSTVGEGRTPGGRAPGTSMMQRFSRWRFEARQKSVSTAFTSKKELDNLKPIAAFLTTYRLGKIWQHGELLLAFRDLTDPDGPCLLDVFDRVGRANTSPMKAKFMHTDPAIRLRPHYVRALHADPARGFMLRRRRCFGHISLDGVESQRVHDVRARAPSRPRPSHPAAARAAAADD